MSRDTLVHVVHELPGSESAPGERDREGEPTPKVSPVRGKHGGKFNAARLSAGEQAARMFADAIDDDHGGVAKRLGISAQHVDRLTNGGAAVTLRDILAAGPTTRGRIGRALKALDESGPRAQVSLESLALRVQAETGHLSHDIDTHAGRACLLRDIEADRRRLDDLEQRVREANE